MKNKSLLLFVFIFLISTCRMPSDPIGEIKIIKRLETINTGGDCLDIDVDIDNGDNVLVAAANYNGFIVYDIQYDGDNISDLVKRVHIGPYNMDPDVGDNRAQEVIIAPKNNLAFILDKEDHIWLFNYNEGINTNTAYLSKDDEDACYGGRGLSIAVDESITDIRSYIIVKHYSSGDWKENSRSLISKSNTIESLETDNTGSCRYFFNQNNIINKIYFSDSLLTIAYGQLGVKVFKMSQASESTCIVVNDAGELDYINNHDECFILDGSLVNAGELIPEIIMAFDTPGEVESIYSKDKTIFVGLSKSNGFIKVQLNSDGSITDYSQYGIGYSIKGIHHNGNILAVAAGHDGVLLYNWDGVNLSFKGRIDTAYANNVKVGLNVIFVATEDGIDIIQVEI